ncbi:hypothetical protein LZ198_26710 [Myxococcus sp. K15C18031901]|uniref:hypothetical protein n=1 Tax=Myxococcus dinghuensis TaxID=2906761 RepID=UPI0020A7E25B|nr:hypothetical protein [Myxococcus dinghuensis]MCP3102470.1 hypothetical protein [Myxococcus dinghuensis]
MSIRQDYLERMVEQFAAALAKLLRARQEQRFEDADRLLRQTSLDALGMDYDTLLLVDAASAARMLGTPERVQLLARLVAEDGELRAARGDLAGATTRREHAKVLERLARGDPRG